MSDKVLGYFYSLMMKSRSGPLVLLYVITSSHVIHFESALFQLSVLQKYMWTYRLGGIARHSTIQDELGSYNSVMQTVMEVSRFCETIEKVCTNVLR